MVDAYKALTAYSSTSDITSDLPLTALAPPRPGGQSANAPGNPGKPLHVRVTARLQKPALAAITTDEDGEQGAVRTQVVCDGKTLFVLRYLATAPPARYTRQGLRGDRPDSPVLWMAFAQSRLRAYSPLGSLLLGQNPLGPVRSRLKQLTLGPPTETALSANRP